MISEKKYFKPTTIKEAMQLASAHHTDFKFIAGGTDIIVNKFQDNESANCLIDITGIKELQTVIADEKYLCIGSLITLDELKSFKEIKYEFPVLLEAAKAVGSPMIRKSATLGGNLLCENRCIFYNQSEWWRTAVGYCLKCDGDICIATGGPKNCFSKFVSDTAIALISLDACVAIEDNGNAYTLSIEEMYSGDGVTPHKLNRTSLIQSIQIPLNQGFRSVFKKLRQRETMEFSSLSTAVTVNNSGKIKIVIGAVDPKPIIIEGTIKANINELIAKAVKKPRIVDNDVYSRKYRKLMIEVFLKRSFAELEL